jgi:hypothetical protein
MVALPTSPFHSKSWSSPAFNLTEPGESGDMESDPELVDNGHHLNRPEDNLLINNQNPCPSYTNILTVVRRLLRKTNILPEKGSCSNTTRQNRARPSIPLRKSIGSVHRYIRIWGVIWIIVPFSFLFSGIETSPNLNSSQNVHISGSGYPQVAWGGHRHGQP